MISKDKIIAAIEEELVGADNASTDETFNKHMYTIHTLSGLFTKEESVTHDIQVQNNTTIKAKPSNTQSSTQISNEEIRKMGGKVSQPSTEKLTENQLTTDDGIGNGDSLFDF
ncbi:DUF5327 family protein [Mammaliicoccus sp. Dog046]|uniref:DUF5327 family protein n=1 Tax=Mammaliicoccus sp. Dog046 TaxID=3034233 RepID=UPI002B25791F|nr:DUF5327 family protein [Mammaliicoccus sp. Dog046]WQK85269.1 DUF5327 family protein [Mammaliicoccus sp. Dog046]